ncbi:uncharacterized protein NECHADRAFT_78529 [Fusarium vanettenii 77-13-4]|uniref:FAD-binding PCMH-type domain-containing protein n=1 Tax=Fusarium vanettenii (strain ATCC MYA-4622 / CBS 123669 / FGSC 9596 / NRRL 45880 / 77-13-4) TaxID=660122 RepID=C7ZLZ3_FUSV7|nr:uncharacterized protein NECHADRAFT_78529 [Fusarium vanettenii 77-13-4]EEU34981.1 hypothetical protein NECHADRAFT_78529 [Fusarium vanettenii 77-13-4]
MLPSSSLIELILLVATATEGRATSLAPLARQDLRSCLSSAVGGDAARAQFQDEPDFISKDVNYHNLNLQCEPFAVPYPKTKDEISEVLACAVKHKRKVQPRSGGRDFINQCLGGADDAIVVDLKHFNHLSVDKTTGIATVGPGNLLKDLVEGLNNAGRFMPHGSSPTVGIGGLIAVGGIGYTSRENGLSIDVMQEVEVILANGTVTRATKMTNSDLFWSMSGAGASFGIATEFKFQTKPMLKELTTFSYNYSTTDKALLARAMKAFNKLASEKSTSRKVSRSGNLAKNSFYVSGVFLGHKKDFDALSLDKHFPFGAEKTVRGCISWIDYMNGLFRGASNVPGQAYSYAKDLAVGGRNVSSDSAVERFVDHVQAADSGAVYWSYLFDWYGGAVNDVDTGATPFPHRNLRYFMSTYATTTQETSEKTMNFIDDGILALQNNKPANYLHYAGVPNLRLSSKAQEKCFIIHHHVTRDSFSLPFSSISWPSLFGNDL